jgi:hypothetical protein
MSRHDQHNSTAFVVVGCNPKAAQSGQRCEKRQREPRFHSKDGKNGRENAWSEPADPTAQDDCTNEDGVWKVGACTEVLSVKVTAHATKTRNAAIA